MTRRGALTAGLGFAAGGALRIWPVFVLGRRFSGLVAIQPGHTLVTSGVYGFIRHPSYLGLLVNALGWGLAFRSGVGVLLTAILGLHAYMTGTATPEPFTLNRRCEIEPREDALDFRSTLRVAASACQPEPSRVRAAAVRRLPT